MEKVSKYDDLLTIEQAAKCVCYSASTIRTWTKEGLKHKNFGRLVRIRKIDLLEYYEKKFGTKVASHLKKSMR